MEPAAGTVEEKTLGLAFSEERERQALTRAEVAQRLHMSAWQVEALEAGDYSRLPKGTFLRGFVRNYAKALGMDANAAVARLAEAAPRVPAPGIVVPSQNIRFDPLGERLSNPYVKAGVLALVAVALVFAGLYWWLFIRPAPPVGAAKKSEAAQPVTGPARSGPPQQIAAAPVTPPEPVPPAHAPTEPAPSPTPAVPAAESNKAAADAAKAQALKSEPQKPGMAKAANTVASGARVVKLRFRGESWVEIRDAKGKVLLSRLNARGSEAEVAGNPPFSVIVGNAPEVQLLYDDREFPLEPHTKVAVARFTLQ